MVLGRVHFVPEGGFDQHFFSFLSLPHVLNILVLQMSQEQGLFTSRSMYLFLSVPGFFWKCSCINCFSYMAETMFSFCFAKHRSHLSVEINIA